MSLFPGRRDILGAAETGSGKTLAFGIPILAGIMKLKAQQEAGVDVYDLPYKKSSVKKNKTEAVEKKVSKPRIAATNKRNAVKKKASSSEDGYGSDEDAEENLSDSDSNKSSSHNAAGEESMAKSDEEFLEEYDVPLRKKKNATDEGSDSDGSDENYVHLSDMLDIDDADVSTDDERENTGDDDGNVSGEETDSQDECKDGDRESDEAESDNKDGKWSR